MASTTWSRPCRPAPRTCGAARRPRPTKGWIVCADLVADPDRLRPGDRRHRRRAGHGRPPGGRLAVRPGLRLPGAEHRRGRLRPGVAGPVHGTGRHRGPHRPPPPGRAGDPRPRVPARWEQPRSLAWWSTSTWLRSWPPSGPRRGSASGCCGATWRRRSPPSSGPCKASGRRATRTCEPAPEALFAAAALPRRPRRLHVHGGARGARLVLGPDQLLPLVPDDVGRVLRRLQPPRPVRARGPTARRADREHGAVIWYLTNVDTEILALRVAVESLPPEFPGVRAGQPWTLRRQPGPRRAPPASWCGCCGGGAPGRTASTSCAPPASSGGSPCWPSPARRCPTPS